MAEKRVALPDMADRQVIGVRKDKSRKPATVQPAVQLNHRVNRNKDVPKKRGEFLEVAAESRCVANPGVKLLAGQYSALVLRQQGGRGHKRGEFFGAQGS